MNKELKELKRSRVRNELSIKILKTIYDFKSEEESDYGDINDDDVINVLSKIIARKTD